MKITTLCYPQKDGKYLMLYRNKKEQDANAGKWIGIGGHLEKGEAPVECAARELWEETGLRAGRMIPLGQIFFYSDLCEDECMYLFRPEELSGELCSCDEGTLAWIDKNDVMTLPLWEGDRLFLPFLWSDSPFFTMVLQYRGEKLISHKIFY